MTEHPSAEDYRNRAERAEQALAVSLKENERLTKAWEAKHKQSIKDREEARLWFTKAQEWKQALAERDAEIEARVTGEIAKRFDHIRSDLNNISRAIEDEGDRCYLGSTNDADELRRIAQEFEDWLLARERREYSKESQP